jgi:hypothetical protein
MSAGLPSVPGTPGKICLVDFAVVDVQVVDFQVVDVVDFEFGFRRIQLSKSKFNFDIHNLVRRYFNACVFFRIFRI